MAMFLVILSVHLACIALINYSSWVFTCKAFIVLKVRAVQYVDVYCVLYCSIVYFIVMQSASHYCT